MNRLRLLILFSAVFILNACNQKPKPVSKNITKTTVTVNGKKDSVINNTAKNYGTATISGPCLKTLLQQIQATNEYKTLINGESHGNIKFVANWVKADDASLQSNNPKITNGIQVLVDDNTEQAANKIATFIYNNEDAKLYFNNGSGQYHVIKNVDTAALNRIRNACYWGVASHQ